MPFLRRGSPRPAADPPTIRCGRAGPHTEIDAGWGTKRIGQTRRCDPAVRADGGRRRREFGVAGGEEQRGRRTPTRRYLIPRVDGRGRHALPTLISHITRQSVAPPIYRVGWQHRGARSGRRTLSPTVLASTLQVHGIMPWRFGRGGATEVESSAHPARVAIPGATAVWPSSLKSRPPSLPPAHSHSSRVPEAPTRRRRWPLWFRGQERPRAPGWCS
jgi:hypothetical protein